MIGFSRWWSHDDESLRYANVSKCGGQQRLCVLRTSFASLRSFFFTATSSPETFLPGTGSTSSATFGGSAV